MPALLFGAGLKLIAGLWAWLAVPASVPTRSPESLSPWVHAALLLVFAASGLLLFTVSRHDRRARALGTLFVLFASIFADPLLGRAVTVWSAAPAQAARLLGLAQPAAFLPLVLWIFVSDFPHAEAWVAGWANPRWPVRLAGGGGALLFLVSLAVGPRPPFWLVVVIGMALGLAFMVTKRGQALPDERRRVAVFVGGLILGNAPLVLDIVLRQIVPPYADYFSDPARTRAIGYVMVGFILVIPVTTAYAVVVDRIFDLRFIIRRAIQYAFARYTVLAGLAVPAILLGAYLRQNRSRPIGEVFADPSAAGWWLLLAALIALLWLRRPLLTAIDRQFFREHYDMRQILTDLVQACRKANSSRDLAALVAGEVDRALHVERIAVLIKDTRDSVFRESTGALAPLDSGSALAVLVGGSGLPLSVDLSSPASPLARLPLGERQWLADAGAQLLVPFLTADDRLVAILVLGDKLSGTPFTQEDRMLLTAAVSSAALGFEHRLRRESDPDSDLNGAAHAQPPASQCVRCGRVQANEASTCVECHGAVSESLLPLVLKNAFAVERQIGAGGMGVVYRARDLTLGRVVALKTLPRVSPEQATRLRREARSMAAMQHTHLAVIHGMEVWRGLPVLVLEYLAGGTLAARIRHRPLPPAEVVSLGVAMASALHHLHRAGLLHRDVKPSNIGFTLDQVPKLLDFGLARVVVRPAAGVEEDQSTASGIGTVVAAEVESAHSRSKRLAGTAAYLSPEAVRFETPDAGFDLWGLAVTLFEATTAVNPFESGTFQETVRKVSSIDVPDATSLVPGVPDTLAEFFRSALSRQKSKRPTTALQFETTLRRMAITVADD